MQNFSRMLFNGLLIISTVCFIMPVYGEGSEITIRGPKSSDAFPYDSYGPIIKDDTLWNISLKVRPDPRISVYQVMQALYENNPSAFKNNNLNYLVNGQYLQIPDLEVIRAVDPISAKNRYLDDIKSWNTQLKSIQKEKKTPIAEMSVQKKDLEKAKLEINGQLQAIDTTQQKRLETIQNDVLDSIDGVHSLLKENELLKQRLVKFNEQLELMQEEVAKNKEIRMQMDDMIALQQELLSKAEASERALLLAKQREELKNSSILSSTWFAVLMGSLPALILILSVYFYLKRKSTNQPVEQLVVEPQADLKEEKITEDQPEEIDDDLISDELSLDEELSIDLTESEDSINEISDDSLNDVIPLDDDLDDASLNSNVAASTEEKDEKPLANDEALSQALDDEIADDDKTLEPESNRADVEEPTVNANKNTNGDDDVSAGDVVLPGENISDPAEIDQLMDDVAKARDNEKDSEEGAKSEVIEESNQVSTQADKNADFDPDDINSILDEVESDPSNLIDDQTNSNKEELYDPEDIDNIINEAEKKTEKIAEIDSKPEAQQENDDATEIDASLDSVDNETEATPPVNTIENTQEQVLTDPDEIDALLDSVDNETEATPPANTTENTQKQVLTDPDEIDALLDSVDNVTEATPPANTTENTQEQVLTEPDEIDALLDSVDNETRLDSKDNDEIQLVSEDPLVAIMPPEEVDAVLNSLSGEKAPEAENVVENSSIEQENNESDFVSLADIDDILNKLESDPANLVQDDDPLDFPDKESEEDKNKDDIDQPHKEQINELSAEYVQSLIENDFSELNRLELEQEKAEQMSDELSLNTDIEQQNSEAQSPMDIGDEVVSSDILQKDPDFNDIEVMERLLADDPLASSSDEEADTLQQLDEVDFDDLLAKIEEGSSTSTVMHQRVENVKNYPKEVDFPDEDEDEENIIDYIPVDDLISESSNSEQQDEPYDKSKIDVGLSEYPEFAGDFSSEENNDHTMAAKLDLAKAYIDIDDLENAEIILKEVIQFGYDPEKAEAQKMLDNLK